MFLPDQISCYKLPSSTINGRHKVPPLRHHLEAALIEISAGNLISKLQLSQQWKVIHIHLRSQIMWIYLTISPSLTRRFLLTTRFILILSSEIVSSDSTIHTCWKTRNNLFKLHKNLEWGKKTQIQSFIKNKTDVIFNDKMILIERPN